MMKTDAAPPDTEQATGTQLLDRTVSVIKLLGTFGEKGARMSEIAESLGLKTSTAHRIVTALERHGLIEREHATKRYRLGLALFALGATAADGTGLRKLCRPALLRLAGETGDTVFLMARSGLNVVCVDRQEGSYVLDSLTGHIGGQIPMGVGPASQAILAFLPEDEADAIIEANAPLYARVSWAQRQQDSQQLAADPRPSAMRSTTANWWREFPRSRSRSCRRKGMRSHRSPST